MLRAFGTNLWIVDGPTIRFMGMFPYPTRMAVIRLEGGDLFIWSPIALTDELADAVTELGPVRHLVEPNKLHHLALGAWSERFPEARTYAPPGLAAKRPDLRFDAELGDVADPAWSADIEQIIFRGSPLLEEVIFYHRASSTALVCDLIQRFEPEQAQGVAGAILRLWGLVGERGSTPLEWRASFLRRKEARECLRRALAWEPERLVIAHGRCAPSDGRAVLEDGLRWLHPSGNP